MSFDGGGHTELASRGGIRIVSLMQTPLCSNCHILWNEEGDCVVADPGGDIEQITNELSRRSLKPSMILDTHGHVDHTGANAALRRATGAPILIHRIDSFMLGSEIFSGAAWTGLLPYETHEADTLLDDGARVSCGTMNFQVMHVPGHSPGSILYYEEKAGIVIGGDLVFQDSVGRYDLPGGNAAQLINSIIAVFLALPDDTLVLTGHGPETTVGRERAMNPFIRQYLQAARG